MSDSPGIPEWEELDIPEDDNAEPEDAEVEFGFDPDEEDGDEG